MACPISRGELCFRPRALTIYRILWANLSFRWGCGAPCGVWWDVVPTVRQTVGRRHFAFGAHGKGQSRDFR